MRARAKINLFLHVLGRREDGYHRLESLMALADIGDDIDVAPAATIRLTVEGPFAKKLPPAADNLIITAARRLADYAQTKDQQMKDHRIKGQRIKGAVIHLVKNLPPASGIGGASADAAAALILLDRLWQTKAGDNLRDIAASLGADVPFCWDGRAAHLGGVGDEVRALADFPPCPIVLVHPAISLSTATIFGDFNGPYSPSIPVPAKMEGIEDMLEYLAPTRNLLTPLAIRRVPVIADVLAILSAQVGCRFARMSGSGATCFGLFADDDQRDRAAGLIREAHPTWWVEPSILRATTLRDS